MSIRKPRSRLVYFRVSEDELQDVMRACESMGARSVSDLARSAVRQYIQEAASPSKQDPLALLMDQLRQTVQELTTAVARQSHSAGTHGNESAQDPAMTSKVTTETNKLTGIYATR